MKLPISVSDQTMFEVTKQPIDTLGSFEQTSNSELEKNIGQQIEFLGARLQLTAKNPQWKKFRMMLVDDVMRAYIARRLIRVSEYKVHWYDSYRIQKHRDGSATVIWHASETGAECRKEFKLHTNLLHAVGRDRLNQCPGAVVYKRGKYEMHPHAAVFLLARHL